MNGEALLYWLSHRGQGAWSSFRQAVAGLRDAGEEVEDAMRYSLSDLQYVEFFIDGSQQWRVFSPQLAGLCGAAKTAILCGARSPKLLAELERMADQRGCIFEMDSSLPNAPTRVTVSGNSDNLAAVSQACRVAYQPDWALRLCHRLQPITQIEEQAKEEPLKWQVKSFDLQQRRWVENKLPETAREYRTRFGKAHYFLCDRQERLWPMEKRRAVYAAATRQRVKLANYDFERRALIVPLSAPLPQAYARAACLCSGFPPQMEERQLIYPGVTPEIAALLLVLAGQPHPGFPLTS